MFTSNSFAIHFLLLPLIAFSVLSAGKSLPPQVLSWSSKTYGPNGPWNAITISIGSSPSSPPQAVDLLPGGQWMTNVISPSVCAANTDACGIPKSAGFYDQNSSDSVTSISNTGQIYPNTQMASVTGALPSLTGEAFWMFDTIAFSARPGTGGEPGAVVIANFDLLVLAEALEELPDGTKYPVQVGKLALGAPHFNQTWSHIPDPVPWNGTLLTSALFGSGRTSSNSYGMHLGSAALGIPGSLNLGGYDQNRVLGPVSSQPYTLDHFPIDLLDIGIGVAEGESPYSFTKQSGLLAAGNSSIGVAMTVFVEATVPYIYLPQSACDAITKNLPVIFKPNLGLYLWDTTSPRYQSIVSSPAFLSFTFRLSNSVSQNLTINVPFALLNLTLTAPILSQPAPYFPLRPDQGPSSSFTLGRAFMQAAFVGVNWQDDVEGNGLWFLAQAPGPNTPSNPTPVAISPTDNTITASTVDWKDTWKGTWKLVESPSNTTTSGNSTSGSSSESPSSTPSAPKSPRLSKGAIAGIAIAVVLGLAGAVGVAFFIWRRQRKNSKPKPQLSTNGPDPLGEAPPRFPTSREEYRSSGYGPRELDAGNESFHKPYKPEPSSESDLGNGAHQQSLRATTPGSFPIEMAG
ncbi:uncharacterized protein BP5553_04341 [Venustampulla echinocandica]|uniref:Peptidase A1 domain-containing protein n=1 Tax=Venustampulla echinocandica TaxID=2656787 RepID=A0A370TWV0_9HELO|nr:uncharacterized protein BP5553_04341 [Venustampulla echinocandica]RDL40001.1 hypothetical protein BP5553_04341 [Venustampulla echinocandica]